MYSGLTHHRYTDLKIDCGGHIFYVHRLVVCHASPFLKHAAEALGPGYVFKPLISPIIFGSDRIYFKRLTNSVIAANITLSDEDPAILKLVINSMYLCQFDTVNILVGTRSNNFLIVLEAYRLAQKLQVNIAMEGVLDGLQDVMRDIIIKLHVPAPQRTPLSIRKAYMAMLRLVHGFRFLLRNPAVLDDNLRREIRMGFDERIYFHGRHDQRNEKYIKRSSRFLWLFKPLLRTNST